MFKTKIAFRLKVFCAKMTELKNKCPSCQTLTALFVYKHVLEDTLYRMTFSGSRYKLEQIVVLLLARCVFQIQYSIRTELLLCECVCVNCMVKSGRSPLSLFLRKFVTEPHLGGIQKVTTKTKQMVTLTGQSKPKKKKSEEEQTRPYFKWSSSN